MIEDIKSWQEVLEEINNTTIIKSTLLGNGFSMAWDYKKFEQQSLKLDYLCDLPEKNVETCIEALQNFEHPNEESHGSLAKKIIENKIKSDFMQKLFDKLPKKTPSDKKTKLFVDFLNLFDNYFTLNYDPLLYFLLNKYKRKDIDIQTPSSNEPENNNTSSQTSGARIAEIKQKIEPEIEKILKASWYIESEGIKLLEEEINEQTHNFIRSKLIAYLKNRSDLASEVNEVFGSKRIKKEYSVWFNDTISNVLETPVKDELKVLKFNDGFIEEDDKLIWKKNKPCSYFHIHGAFHIVKKENNGQKDIFKISSTSTTTMMSDIDEYLDSGYSTFAILKPTTEDKKQAIEANEYLKTCFEKLKTIDGILVTHGVKFAQNDEHIANAIIENNNLEKIYIGLFKTSPNEYDNFEYIKNKFSGLNDKVVYFESNKVFIEPDESESDE